MYDGVPISAPVLRLHARLELRLRQLGDAEVEHLDEALVVAAALDQDDVVGLEIAVDDAGGVRSAERAADAVDDVQRAPDAERPLPEQLGQRSPSRNSMTR